MGVVGVLGGDAPRGVAAGDIAYHFLLQPIEAVVFAPGDGEYGVTRVYGLFGGAVAHGVQGVGGLADEYGAGAVEAYLG